MTQRTRTALLLCFALSASWACSTASTPVDIGDARTGQRLEDYAAAWKGYAEAYDFADGSDQLQLSLDASGNGTLEVGSSPAIPPATDPNAAYPASYRYDTAFSQFTNLFPGFKYAIEVATVESGRLQFTLNPWQIERDWCKLQPSFDILATAAGGYAGGPNSVDPLPAVPDGYLVGPDSGGFGLSRYRCVPDNDRLAFGDAKTALCWNSVCWCDAQGCSYYQPPSGAFATRARLDATLDDAGESLVGTLKVWNAGQTALTVRLKRVHH